MNYTFNTIVAILSAALAYIFGAPDIWIIGLVIMVIVDYITGLMKAYIKGELCSKIGFKGILKKLMYFAIVAVAVLIDNLTGAEGVLRVACIGFLIANEGLSILENCAAAGLPVPQTLIKVLDKLKADNEIGE
ncbi:phage holin family protein [bacterium 210820-DFI.6.37]|nr:phage holin family protein [bacterium 210820-DFI.6.37]